MLKVATEKGSARLPREHEALVGTDGKRRRQADTDRRVGDDLDQRKCAGAHIELENVNVVAVGTADIGIHHWKTAPGKRSLAKATIDLYLAAMSLARSIFRLAFALVFGLTSLVHGPALIVQAAAAQPCHEAAFAAGPSQDAMTSHGATGHAATDASQPQPAKSKATDPAICPMPNCFLMVTPDWPAGPPPARSAGRIEPAVMPEPGALAPDLSDPPPRLRA